MMRMGLEDGAALLGEGRAHGGKLRAALVPKLGHQNESLGQVTGIWGCEEVNDGSQAVVGDRDSLGSPLASQEAPKSMGTHVGRALS